MRLTIAFLALCCLVTVESQAVAKPLRLSGTKLTYADRSTYKSEVTEAVRRWNSSGTPVRLRPVARGKAPSVIFVTKSSLTHQGRAVAGLGGIHFTKKRKPYGLVQLSAAELGTPGQTSSGEIDIVAHELGHAMGLPHAKAQCQLMTPVGDFVRSICGPTVSDAFLCGPQRADAAALAKLYRGKLRWPANGGLCTLPQGTAEFLEPAEGAVASGGSVHVAVKNTGTATWTGDSVALTFVDEVGQRGESPCGGFMSISPVETTIPPGATATFDIFPCGDAQGRTFRLRMLDGDTDTVFGPVRSYVAG